MKAIALASRLARDIDEKSITDISADSRLEILDAINGGLQRMHALAPHVSKVTTGSIALAAPVTVSIGVTHGSVEITGYAFTADQLYGTIRIAGDDIDNQIVGEAELLHPYNGTTGTVSAVIYWDGVALPEPYDELVGDPTILETGRDLVHHKLRYVSWQRKQTGEPRCYWMEANASNQNSPAPSVIRFDTLPDRAYRLEARFTLAPARISFADLLSPGADIPLRAEQIEVYLLPIARGILSGSSLWMDKESRTATRAQAEDAEKRYEALIPQTLATPRNRVGTKRGY